MRTVSELNQQNAQLHDELKTVKNDLRVANIQVDDLKKLLEELRSDMLLKVAVVVVMILVQLVSCICVLYHNVKHNYVLKLDPVVVSFCSAGRPNHSYFRMG